MDPLRGPLSRVGRRRGGQFADRLSDLVFIPSRGIKFVGRGLRVAPSPLLNLDPMSKKRDIRQVEAVAREFDMDSEERREFGDYIEDCKRNDEKGSGKDGDFTYRELCEKVPEFRGEQ